MIFFLRFFLRNVKSKRNRRSDGQTTYPCVNVVTVLVDSSLSTSISTGPGLSDIRARSVTFVVCVAENNIDCRPSELCQTSTERLESKPFGKMDMIFFICSSKPISSIRSASSMTSALRFRNTNPFVVYGRKQGRQNPGWNPLLDGPTVVQVQRLSD